MPSIDDVKRTLDQMGIEVWEFVPLSARTPLGLSHDLRHCILSEVGDLSVSHDLLSHEPD